MENGSCGYILKPEYMRSIHTPKPAVCFRFATNTTYTHSYMHIYTCMPTTGAACALDLEHYVWQLPAKARRGPERGGAVQNILCINTKIVIHTYIVRTFVPVFIWLY